jgi:hypothetical protein
VTSSVQLVAIAVSVALLLLVLELVRRRALTEEYSFLWVVMSLALLALSIWRDVLHAMARWLGIFYPPALLLLLLIFFVFVASLYFSVVISRQRRQIERLVEDQAILAAEVEEMRDERHGPAPAAGAPEPEPAATRDDG